MKKLIALMISAVLLIMLPGCGKKDGNNGPNVTDDANASLSLTEMMNEICKDVETPPTDIIQLDKENFNAFSFIPWEDGLEAVCSESMISSSAHSLVLIRTGEKDAKSIAEKIAQKADIRKWICVEAEVGKVLYTDNYVLMIMTFQQAYDPIKANFETLVGADHVTSIDIQGSGN